MIKQIDLAKPFVNELLKLSKSKDAVSAFYTKNARSSFFMLESIARLNAKAFDDKASQTYLKLFKKFEDQLGIIDYYDVVLQHLQKQKKADADVLGYFERKKIKAFAKLDKYIRKVELVELLTKSTEALALDDTSDKIESLQKAYLSEIESINDFVATYKKGFTDMELQVHELRRKLRWLSIYAQAFGGVFVLQDSTQKFAWEKLYVTAEAKKSPYNTLPENKALKNTIALNKTVFYALSTLIKELGALKDEGLTTEGLQKAIRKTKTIKKEDIQAFTETLLPKAKTQAVLLEEAHALADEAILKQGLLNALVITEKKPAAKKQK